jgi:hypothetical protein
MNTRVAAPAFPLAASIACSFLATEFGTTIAFSVGPISVLVIKQAGDQERALAGQLGSCTIFGHGSVDKSVTD